MLKYIKIGLEEGGELVTGGERYTENGCDKGFFMKPTILISEDKCGTRMPGRNLRAGRCGAEVQDG